MCYEHFKKSGECPICDKVSTIISKDNPPKKKYIRIDFYDNDFGLYALNIADMLAQRFRVDMYDYNSYDLNDILTEFKFLITYVSDLNNKYRNNGFTIPDGYFNNCKIYLYDYDEELDSDGNNGETVLINIDSLEVRLI